MAKVTMKIGYVELETDDTHKSRRETDDGYLILIWKAEGNLFGDYVYNVTKQSTGVGFGGFAESMEAAQTKTAELLEGMRNEL